MTNPSSAKGILLFVAMLMQASLGQSEQMIRTRGSNGRRKLSGNEQVPAPTPAPTIAVPTPSLAPALTPAPVPGSILEPASSPTSSPTQKQARAMNTPSRHPTPPPFTLPTTPKPTNWPSGYLQSPVTPAPATVVVRSRPPTPLNPTFSPMTSAPITVTKAPVISTNAPTDVPSTQEPSISPTALPTTNPVAPSAQPTTRVSPTTGVSPTTESPTTDSPTTKSPTTKSPTTKSPTTASPIGTPAPTTDRAPSRLDLLDFNILLTNSGDGVSVSQLDKLDKTLEAYLLEGMNFTNLESISLALVEGAVTVTSSDLPATPFFCSGFATFSGKLPVRSALHAKQRDLLHALPDMQAAIDKNSALNGVSASGVRFNRIDAAAASSLGSEDAPSRGSKDVGLLLGVVLTISVASIAGVSLVVRQRRSVQTHVPAVKDYSSPATKDDIATIADVKQQCETMVSGEVALGNGELSTKMMTASPKTCAIITTNPTIPEDISIRRTDDFYDDDSYLTMDETLVAS